MQDEDLALTFCPSCSALLVNNKECVSCHTPLESPPAQGASNKLAIVISPPPTAATPKPPAAAAAAAAPVPDKKESAPKKEPPPLPVVKKEPLAVNKEPVATAAPAPVKKETPKAAPPVQTVRDDDPSTWELAEVEEEISKAKKGKKKKP